MNQNRETEMVAAEAWDSITGFCGNFFIQGSSSALLYIDLTKKRWRISSVSYMVITEKRIRK